MYYFHFKINYLDLINVKNGNQKYQKFCNKGGKNKDL